MSPSRNPLPQGDHGDCFGLQILVTAYIHWGQHETGLGPCFGCMLPTSPLNVCRCRARSLGYAKKCHSLQRPGTTKSQNVRHSETRGIIFCSLAQGSSWQKFRGTTRIPCSLNHGDKGLVSQRGATFSCERQANLELLSTQRRSHQGIWFIGHPGWFGCLAVGRPGLRRRSNFRRLGDYKCQHHRSSSWSLELQKSPSFPRHSYWRQRKNSETWETWET